MKRPFPITLTRDSRPGYLKLRLVFRDPLTRSQEVGWRDVLKTFIEAAGCGAMSGSGIAPVESGCTVEQEVLEEYEGVLQLRETVLDASAFTVLLNLCHWGHINVSTLGRFVLCWDRCPDAADMGSIAFPLVWPRLSFELREYALVGQTIAIDIEFMQPQSAERRDQINESIGYWFKAANWGGYADDQRPLPASTVVIAQEPMTTDPWGVSWYLEAYECSHLVFDGLLNCLEHVSGTQAPIRRVLIGA
jgi:hypothetical protein